MANDVLQDVLAGRDPAMANPDSDQTNVTAPGNGTPQETAASIPTGAMADALKAAGIQAPLAPAAAQPAAPKSTFLTAMKDGSDKASEEQQKNGTASQPGAWARSLVAGAQSALGGVGASLGDAAAVGELPKHTNALGGVLTGIARTENARSQRMTNEQQQQLQTAKANIEMHHQQLLIQQLDEQMQQKHVDMDQQALAVLRTSPVPMETVGHNVTSDDITAMLNAPKGSPNKINTGDYTAFQSGIGDNGRPLFDVVKLPAKVSLNVNSYDLSNPEAAAQADKVRQVAKDIKTWTGKDFEGSDDLTGAEFNKYYTMAKGAEAADDARKEYLKEQGVKAAELNDKFAWTEIAPVWSRAISGHEQDPVEALRTLETQHPDLIKQYPNLPELVRKNYGETQWEERIKANQKAVTDNKDTIDELNHGNLAGIADAAKAESVKAAAGIRLADNPNDKEAQLAYRLADNVIKGTEADKVASKKAADEAAYDDDQIKTLADGALKFDMDPERWRGLPGAVRTKVTTLIHKTDPTWSENEYEQKRDTIKKFVPGNVEGNQVQSLNVFAGHAASAVKYIPALNNSNSPDYNTAMNKIGEHAGAEQYGVMRAKLAAVKDEYLKFLNGNHAMTKEDQAMADSLLDENKTPKQLHDTIAAMADTVAVRGGELQRQWMGVFNGKPNNQLLDPDANAVLKSWGINTDKMNGIIVPRDGNGDKPLGQARVNGAWVFQMKNGAFVNAIGQAVDPKTGRPASDVNPQ
jgi:hypothetical protein